MRAAPDLAAGFLSAEVFLCAGLAAAVVFFVVFLSAMVGSLCFPFSPEKATSRNLQQRFGRVKH
jgi:hypothetical protein